MTGWPHGSGEMAERIRNHDWSSTPLGPSADWPRSLKTTIDLMIGSPQFTILVWGPDQTMFYNDPAAFFLGKRHPALGRRFPEIWQGQGIEAMIAATMGGRPIHYTDQYFETPSRPGHPFGWFTGSWTPLRDESGAVVGAYITGFETTERVLAERALQGREAQHAFLLRLTDALRPLDDPGAILGEACQLLGDHLGTDHAYYVEIRERDGLAVIDQDHARGGAPSFVGSRPLSILPSLGPLYRTGRPVVIADTTTSELIPEHERAILAADGRGAWIAIPLVKRGELVGALTVVQTKARPWSEAEVALVVETGERIWAAIERARAERQAREAEARLRTMADAAPVLIWDMDPHGNVFVNEHYLAFFGVTFENLVQEGWVRFLHPDDAEGYAAAYREAYARREPFFYEARVFRADGQCRWLINSGRPHGRDRFVGISIDITERREAVEGLRRNNAILHAINRIFSATFSAASVEELARIALDAAADLTESPTGVVATFEARSERLTTLAAIEGPEPGAAAALERAIRRRHDPTLRGPEPDEPAPAAILSVPLNEGEALVGAIGLAGRPGGYRPEDREAAEALAPAIRHALLSKRGDLRLRESEARFRQFAQASSDVLWIVDAETFASEFASPALRAIYGMSETEVLGDARLWAAHIVPEDRARTFAEMERVRGGEAVVYEFRILRPSDGTFRVIRNHGFPLLDEDGRVRRIGGITTDVTEMRQSEHHQRVLLAELQHRVRNIMALIRSIVMRSGERAESVGEYAALVGGRLLTLARVQSRLTRAADAGVPITAILRDEIGAQAECDDQYDLAGPEIVLAPKAAEVLTLAIHELTTNALKHGALSNGRGRVSVRWRRVDHRGSPWLSFLWIECGGPAPAGEAARRRGFGSELIEGMIPYELSGRGRIELTAEGARCHLEFPLTTTGASILETQAPQLASVFGGSLDLRGEADLDGQRILVAEDEFYLAGDTARALEAVGATVLGPYAGEAAALDGLGREAPTAAVVDIDLGGRPSFALPRALAARGVPFVFVTGYETRDLPPEFFEVPRLEKPVELRRVVGTLARMLGVVPLNPA